MLDPALKMSQSPSPRRPEPQRNGDAPGCVEMELGTVGEVPELVPDGDYQVGFVRAERGRFKNLERIYLWFSIITPGAQHGVKLYLVCPCPKDGGKKFGIGSKLFAAAAVALGHFPKRRERISTRLFAGKVFLARTRTVTADSNQKLRQIRDHYSLIDKLLRLDAGAR